MEGPERVPHGYDRDRDEDGLVIACGGVLESRFSHGEDKSITAAGAAVTCFA